MFVDTSAESVNRALVGGFAFAERKRIVTIEQPQTDCLIRAEQLVILDLLIFKCKQPAVVDNTFPKIIVLGLAIEIIVYYPCVCTVSND